VSYSLLDTLRGKKIVVFGGTGFLGKVWLSLLLTRFPEIDHIFLVVRPKAGQGVSERFWDKVVGAEVFDPLKAELGDNFEPFVRSKVTAMAGDVSMPLCGIDSELRARMRGQVDAVVNVAGIVDFAPPLDEALEVNAFGCQNLVQLAKDLGTSRILHTSTCYTAGSRTGPIAEVAPTVVPFPRAHELEVRDWSPEREISECLDVIEQARHRAGDAFRKSAFLAQAKQNLLEREEPTSGDALEQELAKVTRKFIESELAALGTERARYWGWPNTYTYTKSIGEQIVAASGLDYAIVRPAIVESTLEFPFPGWNEGINTSAPFIFLIREGGLQVPGSSNNLDFIPCDLVCSAITLALGELIDGSHKPVYQAASSDTNPCTMARFFELSGLYKRKYYQRTQEGGPFLARLQQHYESAFLSKAEYEATGPKQLARGAEWLAKGLSKLPVPTTDVERGLQGFAKQQRRLARVMDTFLPFVAEYQYIFETQVTRAAYARLPEAERRLVPFEPETINWRDWFMEIHAPALEKRVFPLMQARQKRPPPAPRAYESLNSLFGEACARFGHHTLFQLAGDEGLAHLSYLAVHERVRGLMRELRGKGVGPGVRVVLSGPSGPTWPVAFFAILGAGGTVVPLDPGLGEAELERVLERSGAKLVVGSGDVLAKIERAKPGTLGLGLETALDFPDDREPFHAAAADDLAALLFTSGTTDVPKGVMLSHGNFTSLVAALGPLFPLGKKDRLVSVLPLHHTFELTCGLLLPLSRGATITYLTEVNGQRVARALRDSRATALIGVPALWEALERRILERVRKAGPLGERVFDWAIELAQTLSKVTGLDVGRAFFGTVHQEFGGHLRYLVSGGAALSEDTHALFQGLGLPLSEGYGLTEASPVLTVQKGTPRAQGGLVGRAVPGIEVKVAEPDENGVGEVWARGKSIMKGYLDDPEATHEVLTDDGWLKTGDLGRLDGRGRLRIAGRSKDVVVGKSGENIYPDDVERQLGQVEYVAEFAVLGLPDGRGGERLGLVGRLETREGPTAPEDFALAREALFSAYDRLLPRQRPALTLFYAEPLPRTRLGKVKRQELRVWALAEMARLERGQTANLALYKDVPAWSLVRDVLRGLGRAIPIELRPEHTLRGELGLDSLSGLELLRKLELRLGQKLDPDVFSRAATVGDVVRLIENGAALPASRTSVIESSEDPSLEVPPLLRRLGRGALERASGAFLRNWLTPRVHGAHNIPHNRSTIVFANHSSHLDAALIVEALGSYGRNLAILAASDYFFEGNRYKRAFFSEFTPLVAVARDGSLSSLLEVALECLDQGRSVLVFPEGTRSPDGRVQAFKHGLAQLFWERPTDLLPVWLEGTHAALPRGARMVRPRAVEVRFGAPLVAPELLKGVAGLGEADATRTLTRAFELSLLELSRGREAKLDTLVDEARRALSSAPALEDRSLKSVFLELEARFLPGALDAPISYYFSLGDERWTLLAGPTHVQVSQGKTLESVDCVLKTTPDIFEKIVREAYVPSPAEFLSGKVKTSNLNQLMKMQVLFQLGLKSDDFWAQSQGPTEGAAS
jgi:long-chain acyl-CoA synthetase